MCKVRLLCAQLATLFVQREVRAGMDGQRGMADQDDQQHEQPLISGYFQHGRYRWIYWLESGHK